MNTTNKALLALALGLALEACNRKKLPDAESKPDDEPPTTPAGPQAMEGES